MMPFKITARILTPVCVNAPWIMLDGVLTHLALLRKLGRGYYELPTKVPLEYLAAEYKQIFHTTQDVPHASVAIFDDALITSLNYYKRFEERGFPARRKVSLGSGYFRSFALRSVYIAASRVTFYGCGNVEYIAEILPLLTHLGNDVRVGWGALADVRLELEREDRSLVWEGRAMRPIPCHVVRRYEYAAPLPWRPPYWLADNVVLCVPPGAEVEL